MGEISTPPTLVEDMNFSTKNKKNRCDKRETFSAAAAKALAMEDGECCVLIGSRVGLRHQSIDETRADTGLSDGLQLMRNGSIDGR